jgi:hypothetical protein
MEETTRIERTFYGICLTTAPILLGISTFFWQGHDIGITGGTLQVYSFVAWIPAMFGLLALLRPKMPRLATWGMLMATFACIGGVDFGMEGVLSGAFAKAGATADMASAVPGALGVSMALLFPVPGLFFPLTLLVVGIALMRTRTIPAWVAVVLCVAAIGFPVGRIPRIEPIAHLTDLLLLVSLGWIGSRYLGAGTPATAAAAAMK